MANMRISTLLFSFCLLSQSLAAQTPLGLDECVQRALRQNLQIKIAEANVSKASQQIAEVRSALLPQLSGEYNFTYNPDLPPVFLPGFIVGQPETEFVPAILGLQQTQFAGVKASQQLFNPQVFNALKATKTANQLTALELAQAKEEVVYQVSATYYNLLALYKAMALLETNIESFETTISTTKTLQRNDLAKKSDVNRLVLAQQGLETQLRNLRVTETTLLNVLRLLTRMPDEEPFAIRTEVERENPVLTLTDTAVSQRTDFRILQTAVALNEIERKGVLASYMPTVVLFGGYFSYAFHDGFDPSARAENRSFDVSQIGVSLTLPLFDGGQRHAKTQQKNYELQGLRYQHALVHQQARHELANAAAKYEASLAVLRDEAENTVLAETTLNEVKTNYRNGFASVTDIIDAENDLQKTQTNYLTALVNVRLAVLEWKKANGTLLN